MTKELIETIKEDLISPQEIFKFIINECINLKAPNPEMRDDLYYDAIYVKENLINETLSRGIYWILSGRGTSWAFSEDEVEDLIKIFGEPYSVYYFHLENEWLKIYSII